MIMAAVSFTNFFRFFQVFYYAFKDTFNFFGSLFNINPLGVFLTSIFSIFFVFIFLEIIKQFQ